MPRPPGTPTGSPGWSPAWRSPPTPAGGSTPSAAGWSGSRTRALVERYPAVAVLGAWLQALVGPAGGGRALGGRGRTRRRRRGRSPTAARSRATWRCCARCLCRDGVERMRADAQARPGRAGPGEPLAADRRCSWRGSPTCWTARPTGPTRSWPSAVEVATDAACSARRRDRPGRALPGGDRAPATGTRPRPWPSRRLTIVRDRAAGRLRPQPPSSTRWRPGRPCTGATCHGPSSTSPGPLACGRCSPTPSRLCAVQTLLELAPRLPGPGRRRRRQGGPAAGPRHPPAATRPRHPPRPGRGAAVQARTRSGRRPSGRRR